MESLILKLHLRDERVLYYVLGRRHYRLDRAVRTLTHLGGAAATMLVAGILWGLPDRPEGPLAAQALAGSHIAVQILKRSISRKRPVLPVGIGSLVDAPDRFSFPSGHAAAALSVALGLAAVLPGAAAPLAVMAGLVVGMTRCYLGVHYPGDVIAGWLLGGAAFATAVLL